MWSIVFEWVETTELDVFFNGELFEKILLSLPSFGYIKTFQVQNGSQWVIFHHGDHQIQIFFVHSYSQNSSRHPVRLTFLLNSPPSRNKNGWPGEAGKTPIPIPAAIRKGKMTLRLLKDSKLLGDPGMCFVQVLQYGCFLKWCYPPKHPKMVIFSRKTHDCWVASF